MARPYIIWTEPRTAGTALSAALRGVSDLPALADEPFQFGEYPQPYAHLYEQWLENGCARISDIFLNCASFKHIPESFDDGFNIELAKAANYAGYRHIHLVRGNVFAQLMSRGIAEQLGVWSRDEARERFASLDSLAPLDVERLIENVRVGAARWAAISPHLRAVLTVRTEDVTNRNRVKRYFTLRKLLRFLELPPESLGAIDRALLDSGQNTESVWPRVPNAGELLAALAERGLA